MRPRGRDAEDGTPGTSRAAGRQWLMDGILVLDMLRWRRLGGQEQARGMEP